MRREIGEPEETIAFLTAGKAPKFEVKDEIEFSLSGFREYGTIDITVTAKYQTDRDVFDSIKDDMCPDGFFPCHAADEEPANDRTAFVSGIRNGYVFTATGYLLEFLGDYSVTVRCNRIETYPALEVAW